MCPGVSLWFVSIGDVAASATGAVLRMHSPSHMEKEGCGEVFVAVSSGCVGTALPGNQRVFPGKMWSWCTVTLWLSP